MSTYNIFNKKPGKPSSSKQTKYYFKSDYFTIPLILFYIKTTRSWAGPQGQQSETNVRKPVVYKKNKFFLKEEIFADCIEV